MPPSRTFLVEAHVGRVIAGWPFGRFDIGDDELTVRSWLIPLFRPRSVPRSTITEVAVCRRLFMHRVRITDSAGACADISLALAGSAGPIIGELQRRGYPVADRRKRARQAA